MFSTIKAKVTAYKWVLVLGIMSALTIGLVWQYHRTSEVENLANTLTEQNTTLATNVGTLKTELKTHKESTAKALEDLEQLRQRVDDISKGTNALQGKLDKLTPPAAGGTNAETIEKEVNALNKEVFDRIERASKGEVNK